MVNIIPQVNNIKKIKGHVSFSNYQIVIERRYEQAVIQFNNELENHLLINEDEVSYSFEFMMNKELAEEQYVIHMDDTLTHVEGGSEKALYYATRTLAQLFNLKGNKKVSKISSPTYFIDDKPRFAFRSFMIDESRHFFGKEEIMKYISLLADLKIAYLHWHLSDDQGFRIDFSTFPKFKEVASKRNKTKINSQDNDDWDNLEYHHYYHYHEIKDIIRFAKEHYVEIIPEIDVPGHTSAIVAAYPELHCFNEVKEVRGDFGVFHDIMCPGKENTYEFTKKLMKEVCILFKDSRYIHLGGDEVSHKNYDSCPDCQKKLKELQLSNMTELQAHFTNEIAKDIINHTGKKVIVWNDGVFKTTDPRIIMEYWFYQMDEEKINFINQGRPTIYAPCSQFYFNDPYGELPLSTTYNRGIHLTNLSRKAFKNIMGMECCVWTEWIGNNKMLEFNTNPRLEAFAEASWTNAMNHSFTDFVERVEKTSLFKFYDLEKAPKSIYLAHGNEYRQDISKKYRSVEKDVEFKLAHKGK